MVELVVEGVKSRFLLVPGSAVTSLWRTTWLVGFVGMEGLASLLSPSGQHAIWSLWVYWQLWHRLWLFFNGHCERGGGCAGQARLARPVSVSYPPLVGCIGAFEALAFRGGMVGALFGISVPCAW